MSRRPGTASSSTTARRNPQTLDAYVQSAIDANRAATPSAPKRSRRKLKRQPQQVSIPLPPTLPAKPTVPLVPPAPEKPKRRKRKTNWKNTVLKNRKGSKIRVRGLVTAEELQDEDEVKEVQEEVRADFGRFGELSDVEIVREEDTKCDQLVGDVIVTFQDAENAVLVFGAYDGKVFGGKTVLCMWEAQSDREKSSVVVVNGLVTLEELEDPDEVADVKEEMRQIFSKHGEVTKLRLSETIGEVSVTFRDEKDVDKVVQAMNGSRYGGRVVMAQRKSPTREGHAGIERAKTQAEVEPKRVATPIVQSTESPELLGLVSSFLKRLAALQERAYTQKKGSKRSRRLVLGMHEVRRGLTCNKIVLLVIATDLDACKEVEEKYVELVAIAKEHEIPILAPMNRRKLGRVLQKKVRVSCVGVYSVDGANDLFQQILHVMNE